MVLALAALALNPFSVSITIAADKAPAALSPILLGGNFVAYQKGGYGDVSPDSTDRGQGIWDPENAVPVPGMVALAREEGIKVARWPGGCATHLYEWKRTIGELSTRPGQKFGLPEFLQFCKAIGALPLISVAEYTGTAEDAANLVEYLNAPDDANHPWARRRAADGHPASWGVKWFEFGNESDHGPHRGNDDISIAKAWSPAEYGRRYMAYRSAMRAIDPTIQLGAVAATGMPPLDGWPRGVLHVVGRSIDFAILHVYFPNLSNGGPPIPPDTLFSTGLAGMDQVQGYIDGLRAVMLRESGRNDVPIALTEFNGGFVQELPVPYRHSLGNSLGIAELLHIAREPRNRIVFANQWEFPNEYWGAAKGFAYRGELLVRRPQFFPMALFAAHMANNRLETTVTAPAYDVVAEPRLDVVAHSGKGSSFALLGRAEPVTDPWTLFAGDGFSQAATGDTISTTFGGVDVNYYHARKTAPARPSTSYRATIEIKTDEITPPNGATIQFGDARGWVATRSTTIGNVVTGTHDWSTVTADYTTLPDTNAVEIIARRLAGSGPVTGHAWYRNIRIQRYVPNALPAAPYVIADASRTATGIGLMVINRDMVREARISVAINGSIQKHAKASALVGPSIDATNEAAPANVHIVSVPVTPSTEGWTVLVPPHSVLAVDFYQ